MRVYLFIAAIAGGATWLIMPLVRHLAIRMGAVGKVRARDVHTIPTPRMGGVGMLLVSQLRWLSLVLCHLFPGFLQERTSRGLY